MAIHNILMSVNRCNAVGDGELIRQMAKSNGHNPPFFRGKAKCEKEGGLATVVRVGPVEKITDEFLLLNDN